MRVLGLGVRGEGPRVRRVVRVRLGIGLDVYIYIYIILIMKSPRPAVRLHIGESLRFRRAG